MGSPERAVLLALLSCQVAASDATSSVTNATLRYLSGGVVPILNGSCSQRYFVARVAMRRSPRMSRWTRSVSSR